MPEIADLATLIAEFLADADSTALYDHDQLRALRANLAHVIASDLGSAEPRPTRGGARVRPRPPDRRADPRASRRGRRRRPRPGDRGRAAARVRVRRRAR